MNKQIEFPFEAKMYVDWDSNYTNINYVNAEIDNCWENIKSIETQLKAHACSTPNDVVPNDVDSVSYIIKQIDELCEWYRDELHKWSKLLIIRDYLEDQE